VEAKFDPAERRNGMPEPGLSREVPCRTDIKHTPGMLIDGWTDSREEHVE